MSNINEKLINYGNLSAFHNSLLNDTSTDTDVTWSAKKINDELAIKQDTLTAGQNISIDASNNISAKGYIYDASLNSFATGLFYGGGAFGSLSHAEGDDTTAEGIASHAEGWQTTASGNYSHAEGYNTFAYGNYSHAEGNSITAKNESEHAEGHINNSHKASTTYGDAGNTQHSVGIGDWDVYGPRNAFEIMQNGDMYVLGVGGYQGTDTKVQDPAIKTLQAYIASLEARIAALEGNTTV